VSLDAQRLRMITEDLESVVWALDGEMRFTAYEGLGLATIGRPDHYWVGRTLAEFLADEPAASREVVLDANRRALQGEVVRHTAELTGRVWQARVEPIREGGLIVGCVGVALDVTEQRTMERTTRIAQRRLEFHVNNSPLGMVEWDADFRVARWSRGCEAIFGWTADEIVGLRWDEWRFVYEADADDVSGLIAGLATGRPPRSVSLNRNHCKDGRVVWCQWFNSVMHDEAGEVLSIVSHVQDVTEREQTRRELRELNDRLEQRVAARTEELSRANDRLEQEVRDRRQAQHLLERREREMRIITDHVPAHIAYIDREYRYRFANSRHRPWIDGAPTTVTGMPFKSVADPSTYELVMPYLTRALSGEQIDQEVEQTFEEGEEPRQYRLRFVPDVNEQGQTVGVFTLVTDETGYHRVERQLRLVSAAIEQVSEFVVITDADLESPGPRILFANSAFYEHTGFTPEEVIGRSPRILQGPDTDRSVLDRLRESLRKGERFMSETTNYRKDGTAYVVAWHIAPVRDESGRLSHWVSIQRDVTDLRRREEADRARDAEMAHAARLATLGEMASGIAHEVNQPLAAIANYASGCLRRLDGGEAEPASLRSALQAIERQASRSAEVIRRVRAFATRREQMPERVSVSTVVESVMTLLASDARRLRMEVVVEGVKRCGSVWVDRIHVEQVLLNLLRNAFDASEGLEASRRRVTVRAGREGDRVRIDVADLGRGFEPADAGRLFEPFFSTKASGMGMGLNICESLIEASGGRIGASPNAGPGATFSIWVPVAGGEGPEAGPGVSPKPASGDRGVALGGLSR